MYSVFIDKVGSIFSGSHEEASENFENFKDYSQKGIGAFAKKNVYLLSPDDKIINSYGEMKMSDGGVVPSADNIIKDFMSGRKIDNAKASTIGFTAMQSKDSSVLIYKNSDGEYPLIENKDKSYAFLRSNFGQSEYLDNLTPVFKDICIKRALKFSVK